jgi:hypothetical protein
MIISTSGTCGAGVGTENQFCDERLGAHHDAAVTAAGFEVPGEVLQIWTEGRVGRTGAKAYGSSRKTSQTRFAARPLARRTPAQRVKTETVHMFYVLGGLHLLISQKRHVPAAESRRTKYLVRQLPDCSVGGQQVPE